MIKVLLIEDNPDDVRRIEQALKHTQDGTFLDSFDFSVAGSLRRGIEYIKSEKFDVVLLDLGLPDVRNFEGLDKFRTVAPHLPIIVLTRQVEEQIIALETINRGAQDYFSKGKLDDSFSFERTIRYAIERKKVEQELVVAREAALKASQAKSEFLASVSHDIRTPLNSIIGVADLLSQAKLNEEQQNYIKMLRRASDNLLTLINDVLDLSKIESGHMQVRKKTFSLLSSLDAALDINSPRAHAKGIELNFKIAEDVPARVTGDISLLNQVLVNLLGNAIKFTKKGDVTLEVSVASRNHDVAHICFQVHDTGMGIPSDKLSVIFDSFTQVEHADASFRRQGSGLGLAICKRISELLGASIHVESQVDHGSTFSFTVPFEIPHDQQDSVKYPKVSMAGLNVLVVDDNPAHSLILKDLFSRWGALVELAESSDEAMNLVNACGPAKKFDLAVVDLRMPGIAKGGLELAPRFQDKVKHVIMMLPTNHRHGDIERLKKAGINNYYFKPTQPERLATVVLETLHPEIPIKIKDADKMQNTAELARPLKILVADDSEDNRLLIEAFCKGTNYQLHMATDGKEAYEQFISESFDLVLMDIQMPYMNGYEALRAIRTWEKSQKHNHVPVLALTAFALKEEADRCVSAGFRAHVTKPITKTDLLETIRKFAV